MCTGCQPSAHTNKGLTRCCAFLHPKLPCDCQVYPRESGADREARREVAMEEAGLRLNYKHRKLMGE